MSHTPTPPDTWIAMTHEDYAALLQAAQPPRYKPLYDDIDRAFFAAELLRDRLEVLVGYGPEALEAEMGTDRARALRSILDDLVHDDSDTTLVRHAL